MKAGLRLQLVLLLGGLLALAFFPLHGALGAFGHRTVRVLRAETAEALTRASARAVEEARRDGSATSARSGDAAVLRALGTATSGGPVEALGVYGEDGRLTLASGDAEARALLPAALSESETFAHGNVSVTGLERGGLSGRLRVVVRLDGGALGAIVRPEDGAGAAGLLVGLSGLYMAVVALALMVFLYMGVTRLILRPVDLITRSAERVADGARRLELPRRAPRELAELGRSLQHMTAALLAKEERLREQLGEIEKKSLALAEAQATLARSERLASVGRLAAGLAHEIGNPLAALMGFEELLLAGGLPPEREAEFLRRMRAETERIHRILASLLEFARGDARPSGLLGAGAELPTPGSRGAEPGDVEAAVTDTLALLRPQRALRELTLATELQPALPRVALGTAELVQVLLNLLLNAAHASPPGGTVTVSAARIGAERFVTLSVEDEGPGVPVALRSRLFEPFVTTKEVGEGTGLGLAVCRGLVTAVGGAIGLDAAHERGARFVVRLPVVE